MKDKILPLLLGVTLSGTAVADVVYVTARQQGCTVSANCPDANPDGTYFEYNINVGPYGAAGTAPGRPATPGSIRQYISSAQWSDPSGGVSISPNLGAPGGVYQIDYNANTLAGNTSTDIVMSAVCSVGGSLSFTSTDKFQRKYGNPANLWQKMGYLTNDPGSAKPTIDFRYQSGFVGNQNRLGFDCWRFTLLDPCLNVAVPGVTGPLATNLATVKVTGIDPAATAIAVYQDSGSGMVQIGQVTTSAPPATVSVPVTGLKKNAQVAATQTVNGQASCVPSTGVRVGGGANPPLRLALSLKENPGSTGPAGANGASGANANIFFMPATNVNSGGAPGYGAITIYPSNDWQTVTITGMESIDAPASVIGAAIPGAGYEPGGTVTLEVYAYKTNAAGEIEFFSSAARSAPVTSGVYFAVNWSWSPVPGAAGYRLLRLRNADPAFDHVDVTGTAYADDGFSNWMPETTVTPTGIATMPAIMWNPSYNASSTITSRWCVLEAIAFAGADATASDDGPFTVFIDDLKNGDRVFQDFESFADNTPAGAVFNQPSYSGTTSLNLMTAPNDATITSQAAYSGIRSQRIQWQFVDGGTNRWVRFNTYNTSVMPNPLVDLTKDISFKILLLPVGVSPVSPVPGPLSISRSVGGVTLNWTGTYQLQKADSVTGPFVDVPGVNQGPYDTAAGGGAGFYRLRGATH